MASVTRETRIWIVLLLLTLVSWLTGHGGGPGYAAAGVVFMALAKIWLIGRDYMELRHAPWLAQAAFALWLVAVQVILSALFLAVA